MEINVFPKTLLTFPYLYFFFEDYFQLILL
jgi:hypothetical protein